MPGCTVLARASTRPCASEAVLKPIEGERTTANPFSTARITAHAGVNPAILDESLAGTAISRMPPYLPDQASPRRVRGKSRSLQVANRPSIAPVVRGLDPA